MLIRTAINLLVIGLNVSIDNATLDAYLCENTSYCPEYEMKFLLGLKQIYNISQSIYLGCT